MRARARILPTQPCLPPRRPAQEVEQEAEQQRQQLAAEVERARAEGEELRQVQDAMGRLLEVRDEALTALKAAGELEPGPVIPSPSFTELRSGTTSSSEGAAGSGSSGAPSGEEHASGSSAGGTASSLPSGARIATAGKRLAGAAVAPGVTGAGDAADPTGALRTRPGSCTPMCMRPHHTMLTDLCCVPRQARAAAATRAATHSCDLKTWSAASCSRAPQILWPSAGLWAGASREGGVALARTAHRFANTWWRPRASARPTRLSCHPCGRAASYWRHTMPPRASATWTKYLCCSTRR